MRKEIIFAGMFTAISLVSCSSGDSADKPRMGDALVDSLLGDDSSMPTASKGEGNLNPPHGEPGHRCEIPVGAPLDSEPGDYVEPNLSVSPTLQPPAPVEMEMPSQPEYDTSLSPSEMLAKGLNPPHGEAGHKCEIPVGAPLK